MLICCVADLCLTVFGKKRADVCKYCIIDITLMKGNQSKTFLFEGVTGAKNVTVQILNDRDPSTAFRPAADADLGQVYAVYLRVINLQGLRRPDGSRPALVFRDEQGGALHTFTQADDGQWTLAD